MPKQKNHSALDNLSADNGELIFGGKRLSQLSQRAELQPFYAYDRSKITARIKHIRHHLPKDILLHYAVKANPMPAVVQHLSGLVDGFDVASSGELRIALDTTMASQDISFAGPGKTENELRTAVASQIVINIESPTELETVLKLAEETGEQPRVALRINPDFELKTSGMKMSGGPKQFGVDAEQAPRLLQRMDETDVEFMGLHIFCGSQNLRVESIYEAQKKTIDLAFQLSQATSCPLKTLNIGGGFGIPYFLGDAALDLATVGENLEELMIGARQRLQGATIVIELGRYITGEAGIYVCRVVDRKTSRGQVYLVTDGGLNHHLAASGNFGQIIRKNYPVLIGNRVGQLPTETVNIVGPLCTPLDLIANKMDFPRAEIGDYVVILQSGAYGFSASPTGFLGHPPPFEMLV